MCGLDLLVVAEEVCQEVLLLMGASGEGEDLARDSHTPVDTELVHLLIDLLIDLLIALVIGVTVTGG